MAYNEKRKIASMRYIREHIKRVQVNYQLDEYARVKAYADARGETVSGLIKRAVREEMQRDN